jgi:hypothetical protein
LLSRGSKEAEITPASQSAHSNWRHLAIEETGLDRSVISTFHNVVEDGHVREVSIYFDHPTAKVTR